MQRVNHRYFSIKTIALTFLHYPLPDYFGAKQYIEIDTEISNFHYNNIKSNFSVGTIVTFFNGQPTQEEQAAY